MEFHRLPGQTLIARCDRIQDLAVLVEGLLSHPAHSLNQRDPLTHQVSYERQELSEDRILGSVRNSKMECHISPQILFGVARLCTLPHKSELFFHDPNRTPIGPLGCESRDL